MEPLTVLATSVAAMIFTGVFEGLGQDLQKQLISIVREKFKASETEKLLKRAEDKPTKSNISVVEAELVTQMAEDKFFAENLVKVVNELEAVRVVHQAMASHIKSNNLETEDMTQRARGDSISQLMGTGLEVSEDIKFGNLTQEGNSNE